jgi:hypothetical protein
MPKPSLNDLDNRLFMRQLVLLGAFNFVFVMGALAGGSIQPGHIVGICIADAIYLTFHRVNHD